MRSTRLPIDVTVQGVANHPEDDLVLATALSGKADYLVTGDKQLLKLARIEDVSIVDSREFLDVLDRQEAEATID